MHFGRPGKKKVSFKEIGLAIALILGRFFFRSDHLHYGFWEAGVPVCVQNLPQAQQNYCTFLRSHIPEGTTTVLDVGCGSGRFARELKDHGYVVDCVSPSPVLTQAARAILGEDQVIFECRFEDLQTDHRYDVIVFSESFQYIDGDTAVEKSLTLLNDGGHILICDFFARSPGKQPMGGGHPLENFYNVVSRHPVQIVEDRDITAETAPTIDVANQFLTEVMVPIAALFSSFTRQYYPAARRVVRWLFRRRLDRFEQRYLSGKRTAETFTRYKTYRLMVLKKLSRN